MKQTNGKKKKNEPMKRHKKYIQMQRLTHLLIEKIHKTEKSKSIIYKQRTCRVEKC